MDYTMYSDRDVCNGISLTSYGHGDPLDLKISVPFKDTAKSYTVTVNGYSVSSMEFSLEQLVLAACGGEAPLSRIVRKSSPLSSKKLSGLNVQHR